MSRATIPRSSRFTQEVSISFLLLFSFTPKIKYCLELQNVIHRKTRCMMASREEFG